MESQSVEPIVLKFNHWIRTLTKINKVYPIPKGNIRPLFLKQFGFTFEHSEDLEFQSTVILTFVSAGAKVLFLLRFV